MENEYPYFAQLMSKGLLPIEICDHILSFSNDVVPVVCTRETVPLGWFYYSIRYKRLCEIKDESELDICKKCNSWGTKCACKSK